MRTIKTMIRVVVLALPLAAMTVGCESQDADFQEIELEVEATDGGDGDDMEIDKPGSN